MAKELNADQAELARRIEVLVEALPKEKGRKQSARSVSLKAGMSGDGIRNIFRESTPLISTLQKLAPFLDCDLGYLTLEQDVPKKDIAKGGELEAHSHLDLITAVKLRKIPVISWAIARDTMVALERYVTDNTPRIPFNSEKDTLLGTYVPDDSMSDEAKEGDVILYDYGDRVLVDKKFYLVVYQERLYFRLYRDTAGFARFEAASKTRTFDPIYVCEVPKIEIIGRVLKVMRDL